MMLRCKNCKNEFYLMNEDYELEGKVVQCKFCGDQWIYESKTKYLENRLLELNKELDDTETKITLKKKEHQDNINLLQEDLKVKKGELEKQSKLHKKIAAFENRLKDTEKLSSEELELDNKVSKIKDEIKTTSQNISHQNKDIEEKTNFLEKKIDSYNTDVNKNEINIVNTSNTNVQKKSEVVDINKNIQKLKRENQQKKAENEKNKKMEFWSPDFFK